MEGGGGAISGGDGGRVDGEFGGVSSVALCGELGGFFLVVVLGCRPGFFLFRVREEGGRIFFWRGGKGLG